jgi:hypothetical protein
MTFSFTATAQCEQCGQLLGTSEEQCDHNGEQVDQFVFRRLAQEDAEIIESTPSWRWHKLAQRVGEEWIAYQYLGRKSDVEVMVEQPLYPSFTELRPRAISVDAPDSVMEEVE